MYSDSEVELSATLSTSSRQISVHQNGSHGRIWSYPLNQVMQMETLTMIQVITRFLYAMSPICW